MAGRDTVIAAGLRAFSRLGFHGASIREIARESGNSLSVLYYYFPSKEELFLEIVRISADEYFATCAERLERAGPDPVTRLQALVEVTVAHRVERRAEANLLAAEIHSLPDDLQESIRAGWKRAAANWDNVINRGIATGQFVCPYPVEARRGIVAMCNSVREWYVPDGRLTPAEVSSRLFSLALVMLSTPSPPLPGGRA